jgi:hypothetical protein
VVRSVTELPLKVYSTMYQPSLAAGSAAEGIVVWMRR